MLKQLGIVADFVTVKYEFMQSPHYEMGGEDHKYVAYCYLKPNIIIASSILEKVLDVIYTGQRDYGLTNRLSLITGWAKMNFKRFYRFIFLCSDFCKSNMVLKMLPVIAEF